MMVYWKTSSGKGEQKEEKKSRAFADKTVNNEDLNRD